MTIINEKGAEQEKNSQSEFFAPIRTPALRARSFFFFSSRRRHTRYWRDWSSDVCSSDLRTRASARHRVEARVRRRIRRHDARHEQVVHVLLVGERHLLDRVEQRARALHRSEERRVGKERRAS